MICVVLAAGYATRLYPLTENFPKPLLKVGDKTILDWLLDDIDTAKDENGKSVIEEYVVISNHKFVSEFEEWAKKKPYKIHIVDDGTITNETRLGAVKDIQYAMDTLNIDNDMLVIAGDNVLDFSITGFMKYAANKNASCIMRYFEPNVEKLKKSGVVEIDDDDRVLSMEEKPASPKSSWCCPPFYYYTRADSKRIAEAIESGCGTDAPGSFISWLSNVTNVYSMEMPGKRYDIGNIQSYELVKAQYKGIIV